MKLSVAVDQLFITSEIWKSHRAVEEDSGLVTFRSFGGY